MGKKVAVAQMNGYFLLVLADVIVPTGAPECKRIIVVTSLSGGHNLPPTPLIIKLINLPQNKGDQTSRPHVFRRPCQLVSGL